RRGQPPAVRAGLGDRRREPGPAREERDALVRGTDAAGAAGHAAEGAAAHGPAAAHAAAGGLQGHRARRRPAHLRGPQRGGGRVAVGDTVVFSPSNKISTIQSIEAFHSPPVPARASIEAGWSTGFTLTEEIYVTRGEVMSHVEKPPLVSTRLRTNLIWLGKKP